MTLDSSHDATTVMCEEEQLTVSVIAPLKAELLKYLESNEDDSDVLKEIERVMLEELSDRYSDQDTLQTGKPRLCSFAMTDWYCAMPIVPCVWKWVCAHML